MTKPDAATAILASHQRHAIAMSKQTPDLCSCNAEVFPVPGPESIQVRRDRAFAAHQREALRALVPMRGDVDLPGKGQPEGERP